MNPFPRGGPTWPAKLLSPEESTEAVLALSVTGVILRRRQLGNYEGKGEHSRQ
jgi:hypothetical protein